MFFTSNIFLFVFLPIVLAIYYLPLKPFKNIQNAFLFVASVLFYTWGEPKFVFVLIGSIFVNWGLGLLISRFKEKSQIAKLILAVGIIFNLGLLCHFKYLVYFAANANRFLGTSITVPEIVLPIGISFFILRALSYIIDVYKGYGNVQKNIFNVGLYISFFPQLIAGPIAKYNDMENQLNERRASLELFSSGVVRFILGLGKKIILANNMAVIADKAFGVVESGETISVSMAWLGAIAYAFQIFFELSGYSDMAIGLSEMFGFEVLENFKYPYISKSITEFCRRWYVSLALWLETYVYKPLEGKKQSNIKYVINVFVVCILGGLWYGANNTLVIFGVLYFLLLVFEKYLHFDSGSKSLKIDWLKHLYTLFFVLMGWVLFRSNSLNHALSYIKLMFNFGGEIIDNDFLLYATQNIFYFIICIVASTPIVSVVINNFNKNNVVVNILRAICVIAIFIVSITFIALGVYNPVIYF